MILKALKSDGDWLAGVSFGLTIYLNAAPTADEVKRMLAAYRSVCPPERIRYLRTSGMVAWRPLKPGVMPHDLDAHLVELDERRDQGFAVWDGVGGDCWSFLAQGVVLRDVPTAASFIQVYFPDDTAPDLMLSLARRLADSIVFLSGHAGHVAMFRTRLKTAAFNRIYAWAKRYEGVEVEDLNKTVPYVLDAVKGASWLTLLGSKFTSRLEHGDYHANLASSVDVTRHAHGWVIRAGERPSIGDRNRQDFPLLYAQVESFLRPFKLRAHGEFAGRFRIEEATMDWLHRLSEPSRW